MNKKLARTLIILLIVSTNIGCDQVSKKIVRDRIGDEETIAVIQHHFTLMRVENTGAFLSLGNGLKGHTRNIVLTLVPLVVLLIALVYVLRKRQLAWNAAVGISFVIGGGIGNIFDRFYYGSVTDFMHLDFGIFQTGIFNMADLSIMTGVTILLINNLINRKISNKIKPTGQMEEDRFHSR